jgi:O-antigen ligase
MAVLGFAALFLTYSRTLWIALPIGLAFWVFALLPKKSRVIFLMAAVLIFIGLSQVPAIHERFTYIHGIDSRTDLWRANWDFFLARPLTGVGWRKTIDLSGPYLLEKHPERTFVFSGHAHNNLIEMLGGTGLLGVLAWLLWCGYGVWILLRWGKRAPEHGLALGLLAAWLVFHINGITQVNFWEGKVLHQMMWMTGWTLYWAKK